jgi:hypothetical protein
MYVKKQLAGFFQLLKWMLSINNWHQHWKCLGRSEVKMFWLVFSGEVRRSRWRGSLHCYGSCSSTMHLLFSAHFYVHFEYVLCNFLCYHAFCSDFRHYTYCEFSSLCVLHAPPISHSVYYHFNSAGSLFGPHFLVTCHRHSSVREAATESAVVRTMSERMGCEQYKLWGLLLCSFLPPFSLAFSEIRKC